MTGSQDEPRTVCRRTVVAAVGGAGLTVALTACGDDAPGDGKGAGSTGGANAPGGDSGGTPGGGGGGKVLAGVAEIPEGGGKIIGDVVVTQPVKGEFKAFSAKCTHQGCAVGSVAANVIVCPCHNSRFDASDSSVQGGPATSPLPSAPIRREGDSIVLA
ncbi:Rieske (2Fe-2S) protein [Streptomyces sp. NPDC006798]|uniref:Rieske (2Fe-2S) protein n=1 Tax=Streptomyces sp. NPDC006798 TaxID=3155462 RepID=UPI00340AC95B